MKELERKINDILSSPFPSYRTFGPNEKAESIGIIVALAYPREVAMKWAIPEEDWLESNDVYEQDTDAKAHGVGLSDSATTYLKVAISHGEHARVENYELPDFWANLKQKCLVQDVPLLTIVRALPRLQ